LSGDKPDTGKQDQQESDLGKDDSRLTAHETDVSYFDKSELPDDPARKLTHYPTPQRPDRPVTPPQVPAVWVNITTLTTDRCSASFVEVGMFTDAAADGALRLIW
jgi:hypothetical protein